MDRSSRVFVSRRGALALFGAGLLTLGAACAPKVFAERTPGFDLESATSYAWVTEELVLIQLGEDQPNVRTPDNEKRVRAAIDRELASRGFSQVAKEEAQVLVAFSVGVEIRYRLEGGQDGAAITPDGASDEATKGTLNIYLIDPAKEQEIWHGWTSQWLSKDADPDTVVNNAVGKIMATYPGDAP